MGAGRQTMAVRFKKLCRHTATNLVTIINSTNFRYQIKKEHRKSLKKIKKDLIDNISQLVNICDNHKTHNKAYSFEKSWLLTTFKRHSGNIRQIVDNFCIHTYAVSDFKKAVDVFLGNFFKINLKGGEISSWFDTFTRVLPTYFEVNPHAPTNSIIVTGPRVSLAVRPLARGVYQFRTPIANGNVMELVWADSYDALNVVKYLADLVGASHVVNLSHHPAHFLQIHMTRTDARRLVGDVWVDQKVLMLRKVQEEWEGFY